MITMVRHYFPFATAADDNDISGNEADTVEDMASLFCITCVDHVLVTIRPIRYSQAEYYRQAQYEHVSG